MKKFYIILIASALGTTSFAKTPPTITDNLDKNAKAAMEQMQADTASLKQVSPWKSTGDASLNLSQAAFSDWSAGGDPSISVNASLNYSLDYKAGKNLWTNRLELAYGINSTSTDGMRKTNDKIYLSSNYGYLIAKNLYAGATATFSTQFGKGYNYTASTTEFISDFMAPGYLSVGLGLTYTPSSWFTLIVSPATYRATFVDNKKLSDLGSFGVKRGEHLLNEFGANIRAEVKTALWKKISLYSRLELYSNYLNKPQNIVVNWEVQLKYSFTDWLTANLQVNMIYDDKILFGATESNPGSPHLQIKEVLGIGFQAKF